MENFLQKAELKACLKPKFFETDCLLQFYGFLVESPERCSDGFQICLNLRNNFFRNCSYYTHAFVTIQGQDLIKPDGTKLFIMGTNLGNWLNPEGYMFKFSKTNSPRFINEMFCQLVGPDFTAEFWKAFKDNYITREDIQFIKNTGANTVFHSIISFLRMKTLWG